jgi:nucleotide-binding universal stress UspA family protein
MGTTGSLPRTDDASVLEREVVRYLDTVSAPPEDDTARWSRAPSVKRILLPFSGLEPSQAALAATVELCGAFDARVRVLHLREWDQCRGTRFFLESTAEARELVRDAASQLQVSGVPAEAAVRDVHRARLAQAILAESGEFGAHLIVLGARSRRLVTALIVGSTSHEVTRGAHCPVVLVHPARHKRWSRQRASAGPRTS